MEPEKNGRRDCLDVLRIRWAADSQLPVLGSCADCGVLLEVWNDGGLLQTDQAIPEGCKVFLDGPVQVNATVTRCGSDDYGYLVEFAVTEADRWIEAGFNPQRLNS